ncbi:hypothetical protein [Leucobacter luti]|uniref:hypothetical protein n=1 Tax=Leucobacter luti TaxID=340320 RepID=UPI001C68A6D6|nr:hypothetical protein [Leucobacter luti]QYM75122.1 hypothetical protein K1X41_10655 [Leucobacter luti]
MTAQESVEIRLQALAPEDRKEILDSVQLGHAVSRAELAPLALEYADSWKRGGGPRLYRKWYYWVGSIVAVVALYWITGWIAATLLAVVMFVGPSLMRDRVTAARRAVEANQQYLEDTDKL